MSLLQLSSTYDRAETDVSADMEHAYVKDGGLAVLKGKYRSQDGCVVKTQCRLKASFVSAVG
ncbi:hypothetical protein [Duncaniella dubosii]|uniref:hypothetical protein n=1 Tax=Duncaniella dubosii TaxID=2518971 RepID=UPI003F6713CA